MYVCMSEAPEHVCMYVSLKPTKSACFGGCQIPHEKRSVFDHQFNFLRFVRGGTSGSLARRQTCMYVCLSSRRTLSMYVCMSEAPEHVCLYVSLKPTKSACFGGCQIPYEKRSVFDHQFNFLRFVRGGTSGGPRQSCMYVCMYV